MADVFGLTLNQKPLHFLRMFRPEMSVIFLLLGTGIVMVLFYNYDCPLFMLGNISSLDQQV